MTNNPKIEVDINQNGIESALIEAPFDEAKLALENQGYRIISAEEHAKLACQEGIKSTICQSGNWVREGFIYVPKKGIYFSKKSPVITNSERAVKAEAGRGKIFYLTKDQVEESLSDAVELKKTEFPVEQLGEDEITTYILGSSAKTLAKFLKENEKTHFYLGTEEFRKRPHVTQANFDAILPRGHVSGISGRLHDLYAGYVVRGYKKAA